MSVYPRLCILTDSELSQSHGTGALLMRQLAAYPRKLLFNVSPLCNANVDFCGYARWNPQFSTWRELGRILSHGNFGRFVKRFMNLSVNRAVFEDIQQFQPELFVCIVSGHEGFSMAAEIFRRFPRIPAYCSFWDLTLEWSDDEREQTRCLERILGTATYTDCISSGIADYLMPILGRAPKVHNFFCCDIPAKWKTQHRSLAEGLQPVMVGNVWLREALNPLLWVLWRAQNQYPTLRDVIWYCHPHSLKRLGLSPSTLPLGITYGGHFTGQALIEKLLVADFCLVPFNNCDVPEHTFARHSIPSRTSELCAIGLPTFALAGTGTSYAEYIRRTGCAECLSPENPAHAFTAFCHFLENHNRRAELGQVSRKFAEQEFAADRFQTLFYERLRNVADGTLRMEKHPGK
jgi:hypothetical protein